MQYAQLQAELILKQAREEAEQFVEQARAEVQQELDGIRAGARDEGYREGYAQGLANAVEEGKKDREVHAARLEEDVKRFSIKTMSSGPTPHRKVWLKPSKKPVNCPFPPKKSENAPLPTCRECEACTAIS